MRIKAEWTAYLHRFRQREIDEIFAACPERAFADGLELGAGDGFQARLLARYVGRLVSTDFSPRLLAAPPVERVEHRVCDAEEVAAAFPPRSFDLVFSSNLLEHLPNLPRALAGTREVLRDDGLAVHVVPSPFWKLSILTLHYPNLFANILERATRAEAPADAPAPSPASAPNNPKTERRTSRLRRHLIGEPHGVSSGHLEELLAFRRARWEEAFRRAGFDLVAVRKGPVVSGYGFGLDRARALLERAGLTSEYVYVACKAGARSPQARFLAGGSLDRPRPGW
jgi:SAM-dependent methyltransferase